MNYNIGQKITFIKNNPYNITNENSICKILDLDYYGEKDIFVEIIEHKEKDYTIGNKFWVNSKFVKAINKKIRRL